MTGSFERYGMRPAVDSAGGVDAGRTLRNRDGELDPKVEMVLKASYKREVLYVQPAPASQEEHRANRLAGIRKFLSTRIKEKQQLPDYHQEVSQSMQDIRDDLIDSQRHRDSWSGAMGVLTTGTSALSAGLAIAWEFGAPTGTLAILGLVVSAITTLYASGPFMLAPLKAGVSVAAIAMKHGVNRFLPFPKK